MKYLKWRLSNGTWGTHPVEAIAALGARATTGSYVDAAGYRIAYLWDDCDLTALDDVWDITEVTQAQALAFAQALWPDAAIADDGRLTSDTSDPTDP